MKNSEIKTQKIINYLHGDLGVQERLNFEEELSQDTNLKLEFQEHEMIHKAMAREVKVESFKNRLEAIHEKEFGTSKSKVLNLQNKWYWAAASVTLLSGTAVYSVFKASYSNEKLYHKYYDVYQPAFITRGIESETEVEAIYQLFESKKYQETYESIIKLDVQTQLSPKIILLKGCTQMEMEKFEDAVTTFNLFETNSYTLYTDAGRWYKALCYIKLEKINEAQILLKQMVNEGNSYSTEAMELLKKIK